MKLVHNLLEYEIVFDHSVVNTLVLEAPQVFTSFVQELKHQIDGGEGGFVLSQGFTEILDLSSRAELIIDPFINQGLNKRFSTKLINQLKKAATGENLYLETSEIQATLLRYASLLSYEMQEELIFSDEIDLTALLKLFNFAFEFEDSSILENLVAFTKATSFYVGTRIFIFVNLKSYLTSEQLNYLLETIGGLNCYILLIENNMKETFINKEKYCIIDIDFCEIFREG